MVTTDPVLRRGRFEPLRRLPRAHRVESRRAGVADTGVRAPVLVIADAALGAISARHRRCAPRALAAGRGPRDLAGVFSPRGPPEVLSRPGVALRGADRVRASIRGSVGTSREPGPAHWCPALVDGDDARHAGRAGRGLPRPPVSPTCSRSPARTSRSWSARCCCSPVGRGPGAGAPGARGRSASSGFVLLARPEPSVLRAAVMGRWRWSAWAPTGAGAGRGRSAPRCCCCCCSIRGWPVARLRAVDAGDGGHHLARAGLARPAGAMAAAVGRRGGRRAAGGAGRLHARWWPRSPGRSASWPSSPTCWWRPAVGPATVLGLAAGSSAARRQPLGRLASATPAAWCAAVDHHGRRAGAPPPGRRGRLVVGPASASRCSPSLCVVAGAGRGRAARAAGDALALGCVLLVVRAAGAAADAGLAAAGLAAGRLRRRPGRRARPRAGPAAAVVVDAGPDPAPDGPLPAPARRAQGRRWCVLTHFHADHVDGLPGVLRGRSVGEIVVTALRRPAAGGRRVRGAGRSGTGAGPGGVVRRDG